MREQRDAIVVPDAPEGGEAVAAEGPDDAPAVIAGPAEPPPPPPDGKAEEATPTKAGEVVVRQGDPGERYYAIADGSFTVSIDGADIDTLERGAGFGEVALLGDVPRMATIAASTDGLLLAIDRQPFLVTVTGHDSSEQAAWGLVRRFRDDDARRRTSEPEPDDHG